MHIGILDMENKGFGLFLELYAQRYAIGYIFTSKEICARCSSQAWSASV